LRDATEDDLHVTYAITEDAMRGYVEETWGSWDPDEQRQKHRANFTPETHKIIVFEGDVAGLVAVEQLPTHVWLVKLYIRGGSGCLNTDGLKPRNAPQSFCRVLTFGCLPSGACLLVAYDARPRRQAFHSGMRIRMAGM
jgi:hypothetical protein